MTKHELIHSLRYQILTPMVTTMGWCSQATCPNPSRGSGKCAECLQGDLIALIGDEEKVVKYVAALIDVHRRMIELEETEEEM